MGGLEAQDILLVVLNEVVQLSNLSIEVSDFSQLVSSLESEFTESLGLLI